MDLRERTDEHFRRARDFDFRTWRHPRRKSWLCRIGLHRLRFEKVGIAVYDVSCKRPGCDHGVVRVWD